MSINLSPFLDKAQQSKFWTNAEVRGPEECWPWKSHKLRKANRGTYRIGARTIVAARFALASKELPDDWALLACHSCDNAECVNPAHLRWGTYADNKADCVERGRVHRWGGVRAGAGNPQAKLTDDQALRIRAAAGWPEIAWTLADDLGVSIHSVRGVRYGRTFKNVK